MFKFMPLKLIALPAIFLGLLVGLACKPRSGDPPTLEQILRDIQSPFVLGPIGIYLALTAVVFFIKSGIDGLNRSQVMLLWIMAFLMGAIGGPLIYDFANR